MNVAIDSNRYVTTSSHKICNYFRNANSASEKKGTKSKFFEGAVCEEVSS